MSSGAPVVVDRASLRCPDAWTETVDVLFDGERVWSFRTRRHRRDGEVRVVEWPHTLVPYLHGETTLTLRDHVSGDDLATLEVRFDDEPVRVAVRDKNGNPLALDKWDNVTRTFSTKAGTYGVALLEDLDRLFAAMEEVGAQAYLSYGSLLGAVRTGKFIAHDTDADISYVSRHDNPALVALEAFQLERALHQLGWGTHRVSAGFLQVWAPGRSAANHIDIFTGYFVGAHYHVDRWVRGPAVRSDLLPLGEVTLEGHTYPAPAVPEHVLELTYGPNWRVPDPSFKFAHPRATMERARGWLGQQRWINGGRPAPGEQPVLPDQPAAPSEFARWVAGQVSGSDAVLELGCRSGVDAVFLAGTAASVRGVDHMEDELAYAVERAAAAGVDVTFERASLYDQRLMIALGAQLGLQARSGHGRVMLAHNVLDHLMHEARASIWAAARTALGAGGRFFLSVAPEHADAILAEAGERGGRVLQRTAGADQVWLELGW
jgi:SAM-dependent methyltransferase